MAARWPGRRAPGFFIALCAIASIWLSFIYIAQRRARLFATIRPALNQSSHPSMLPRFQPEPISPVPMPPSFVEPTGISPDIIAMYNSMTLEQRVGQLLMVSVRAVQVAPFVREFLADLRPGGLILYPYNVAPAVSLQQFVLSAQQVVKNVTPAEMFISVDQEGGRSLRDPLSERQQVQQFPSQMALGVIGSTDIAYKVGWTLGWQLRRQGINMNLAPVLDVNSNPLNPIINMRSFGSTAQLVGQLGSAYVRGLQSAGCLAVGKHFPGHGDTSKDSHQELPVVNRSLEELKQLDLAPFQAAFDNGLAAVMSAHITYPSVVADGRPATLSHRFLTDILRRQMAFRGIVLTDDMKMDAIQLPPSEAAVQSFLAGTDIILSTSTATTARLMRDGLIQAVKAGRITQNRLKASVLRILESKKRFGILGDQRLSLTSASCTATPTADSEINDLMVTARELNHNISQSALLYSGSLELLTPPASTVRVFIVYHDQLRHIINTEVRDSNDVVLRDLTGIQGPSDPVWAQHGTIIYTYFLLLELQPLTMLHSLAKRRGLRVIALCSGNPFQFRVETNHLFDAALLSFSNTPVSLISMALALNGRVSPRNPNVTNIQLTLPGMQ